MKKIIIFIVMTLMLLTSFVAADVEITTNTTSSITVDGFTATVTLNESSGANLFISKSATMKPVIASPVSSGNATEHNFVVRGLEGETVYYWKINGTSVTPETTYDVGVNSFSTLNYKVRGVARIIMGLFALILAGIVGIKVGIEGLNSGKDTKTILKEMLVFILGILIVARFIIAALAA